MSLFLLFFAGVVCFFVVLAVVAELLSKFSRDDYDIPDDWESPVYKDVAGKRNRRTANRSRRVIDVSYGDKDDAPPARKELSASAWYAMMIIAYILCLLALTHWVEIESWLYTAKQLIEQLRARP
jgi:hypothetical protein